MRQQFGDPMVGMQRQPFEYVFEVDPWIVTVELGRVQEAHDDGSTLTGEFADTESQRKNLGSCRSTAFSLLAGRCLPNDCWSKARTDAADPDPTSPAMSLPPRSGRLDPNETTEGGPAVALRSGSGFREAEAL